MKRLIFIMTKRFVYIISCISFSILMVSGCGGAQKGRDSSKCLDQCELDLMSCLESLGCTDHEGQRIPCEEECQRDRAECADAC